MTAATSTSIHDLTVRTIDGQEQPLSIYGGKALLIVNVASRCGYTPQYEGLEKLYQRYKGEGLVVLGFPSNDFGAQEPGAEAEIKQFCSLKYNVTFPMYSKIKVKGPDTAPLYQYLTSQPGKAGAVKWNFAKFLVGKDGKLIERYDSGVDPLDSSLTQAIEAALR